jgi:hypothetical protein
MSEEFTNKAKKLKRKQKFLRNTAFGNNSIHRGGNIDIPSGIV